jgi:ABC-type nitrate/sulfonate/bicarbonate transport system substrate-binding protein
MRVRNSSKASESSDFSARRRILSTPRLVVAAFLFAVIVAGILSFSTRAAQGAGARSNLTTVRLALDWTPNTDHTGFFVAQSLGYYQQAGLNVQILPYGSTSTSVLVNTGKAECGINHENLMSVAVLSGIKEQSIMAISEHQTAAYVTLANSKFKKPSDFDGSTYGGFGSPGDEQQMLTFVKSNGGKGNVKYVNLNTGALAAVIHKKVDFADVFQQWEVIQAQLQGVKLRVFPLRDYGIPDSYGTLLACGTAWLQSQPDVAKRFVAASVRGWQYSIKNPVAAAKLVVKSAPGVFPNAKLMILSQQYLVSHHDLVDAKGRVGCQTTAMWTALPRFFLKQGVYTSTSGKKITSLPPVSTFFSNAYMPYSCS